ncbi:AP-3 complex subunit beta [[Candida] jaroonii]|uniref:AP-3 complex subunit beta n=1 Tax=[Candida] jaroonii TaxID=467808 RepID=A0ACA9Y6N8_9ASCO|nr:AP-3 complex subunit beta [[Candida] jaroonii]
MFETAKDLTIEAAVSASARLADTPSSARPAEISKLLNSRIEKDVSNGMKCVISMMSRDDNALPYFADVVKNITSNNAKVRNMVMIYTTRYAEIEPDTALLAINSIQKALSDKNPNTRSMSIKSLSAIRISSIAPILQLCVKRTVTDNSPLVRSSTAIAIGKVYEIDKQGSKQLFEYLAKLLADTEPMVVGTAIKSFVKIMGQTELSQWKWSMIHGHYRRFCKLLPEFDEWSRSIAIDLLTDYARLFLPRPKLYVGEESIDIPETMNGFPEEYDVTMDSDLELLINSMSSLVKSNAPFVLFSIVRSLVSLAPSKTLKQFNIPTILCAMATDSENTPINLFALQAISTICEFDKTLFQSQYRSLFIFPSDSVDVAKTKLDILSSLVDESNVKYIIEELKYNAIESWDLSVASESIKAIGRCSQVSTEWNRKILKWCLNNIKNAKGEALNEFLTVIRYLIQVQQQMKTNEATKNKEISKIVYNLSLILKDSTLKLPSDAIASIIWIIGEFTKECDNEIAPDVLRVLLKTFAEESENVRYQTLILASKLYSISLDEYKNSQGDSPEQIDEFKSSNIISQMFSYAITLAKADPSFDTRDRARMIDVLLNGSNNSTELASLFLQVPKSAPIMSSLTANNVQGKVLGKFFKVPDWQDTTTLPPASIRKELAVQENKLTASIGSKVTASTITKKIGELPNTKHSVSSLHYNPVKKNDYKLESLDDFFGDESEEDSDSEDVDSDSEEEEDDEEDDEEEEEEEEEEYEDDEVEEEENDEDEDDSDSSGIPQQQYEEVSSDEEESNLLEK